MNTYQKRTRTPKETTLGQHVNYFHHQEHANNKPEQIMIDIHDTE